MHGKAAGSTRSTRIVESARVRVNARRIRSAKSTTPRSGTSPLAKARICRVKVGKKRRAGIAVLGLETGQLQRGEEGRQHVVDVVDQAAGTNTQSLEATGPVEREVGSILQGHVAKDDDCAQKSAITAFPRTARDGDFDLRTVGALEPTRALARGRQQVSGGLA
jgi:hypothetical protein